MKRCYQCKAEAFEEGKTEERLEVAGKTFTATVPVLRCKGCGERYFPGPALEAIELDAAGELARHGEITAEAFGFMRRAMGMKAGDLAQLLDVTPETVSRWERGHQRIERRAAALLSALVLDQLEGSSTTLDRLKALLEPEPLPTLVRLTPRFA